MNKRQGTLILVLRNLVLRVFVTKQIMIHPPQAYRAISKMYKRGENYQHTEEKFCIHS